MGKEKIPQKDIEEPRVPELSFINTRTLPSHRFVNTHIYYSNHV
jgi:hypothetical protein